MILQKDEGKKMKISTTALVRSALLGAIAAVLMELNLRLPIFPGFLQLDVSDLPALIGAVTSGPIVGVLTTLVKNIINPIVFGTNTGGIGNFADFVMGCALVVPIGIIYRKRRSLTGYLLGAVAGLISLVIVASLVNYFILLPLFTRIFMPMETILNIANAVNSNVNDVFTLILFAIIPFNLVKGTIVVILGFIILKTLSPVLARLGLGDKSN